MMKEKKWNRCQYCGVFISEKDFDEGLAVNYMSQPDTAFTSETYVTLCKKHAPQKLKIEEVKS